MLGVDLMSTGRRCRVGGVGWALSALSRACREVQAVHVGGNEGRCTYRQIAYALHSSPAMPPCSVWTSSPLEAAAGSEASDGPCRLFHGPVGRCRPFMW